MKAIFKRELKSYFTGYIGYVFAALLLLFEGIYVVIINLLNSYAAFEFSLENITIVFLLIVPIITMRSIAEEKRAKTDQLLYSLPIKTSSIVLGKYLALLAVLLLPTLIIGLYPILLGFFGNVNMTNAYACLFAFFLLASSLISICMFTSSLTESQIIAAVLGFGALMFFYLAPTIAAIIPTTAAASLICFAALILAVALITYNMTQNMIVAFVLGIILAIPTVILFVLKQNLFEGLFPALIEKLAIFESYMLFTYGIFDFTTVIYYLSISVFFLFLTIQTMEKKRWS